MPEIEYKIVYTGDSSRIIRANDALIASFVKLEAQANRTLAAIVRIGTATTTIGRVVAGINQTGTALGLLATKAGSAQAAVSKVGVGASLARFNTQTSEAAANLNALAAAAGSAGPAVAGVGAGAGRGRAGGGGGGVGRAALGVAIGGAALMGARKVAGAVGESVGERREYFGTAAEKASAFRQDLQGLAILQDKTSADDALMRQQVAFQTGTGLDADAAMSFRLEYGGAIAPGKALGNISDETATDLEKQAALFSKRYDIDPKSAGRMAGLLPMYQKVGSAREGLGELAASAEYLNVYGLGAPREQAPSMLALEADMLESEEGGRFGSMSDLAATFAATTFKARSPASAATQMRQANRLLRRFGDDSKGQFLAKAGITPEMDYNTAVRRIAPLIAGPEGDLRLAEAGFANSTERASIMKQVDLIKVIDAAKADPRIAAARANAGAVNEQYKTSLPFQQATAENQEFGAGIEAGLVGERLRTAKTSARARMMTDDTLKAGPLQSILDLSNTAFTLGGVSGEEIRVEREAMRHLTEQGQQVGVDVGKIAPTATYQAEKGLGITTTAAQEEFRAASEAVEAKRKLIQGANLIIEGANAMPDQDRPRAPAPGDGGAGVVAGRR